LPGVPPRILHARPNLALAREHCEFEQAHRAQCDWLCATHCSVEKPGLFAGEFLFFDQPSNYDMGVQQAPGQQIATLFFTKGLP
jgi:hypothetical protein